MKEQHYPALFRCADSASNQAQKLYMRLILWEYGLLLLAAFFSMNTFNSISFYVIYAMIFLLLIGVLLTRAYLKPVQDWYRCRALAESVKTIAWRYVMRASPFDCADRHDAPREEFLDQLRKLVELNRSTVEKITSKSSGEDQITLEMLRIRALSLKERMDFYKIFRVKEQGDWYASKALANKKAAKKWILIGIAAYSVAGLLVLSRIEFANLQFWPIEPIIVFASSIIGWIQIKKFGELSASYGVTAQEIGLIKPKLDDAESEMSFSLFVNEAELAFSREHTFWIARQAN